MKRILAPILLALTFSVMFSSTSFAQWMQMATDGDGDVTYAGVKGTKKHGGYVYFWTLLDRVKPFYGDMSSKTYLQVDCKLSRFKNLSYVHHKQPMGKGSPSTVDNPENPPWQFAPPNTVIESVLSTLCSYAKVMHLVPKHLIPN